MTEHSWQRIDLATSARPPIDGSVVQVAHLPHVPCDWNGTLVLAQAQNLALSGRDHESYALEVRAMNPEDQARRLWYPHHFPETVPADLRTHIHPWHSGPIPMALRVFHPELDLARVALTNAIPWSWVRPGARGGERDRSMEDALVLKAASGFLKAAFADRAPDRVIACGHVAASVVETLGWPGQVWLQGSPPSFRNSRGLHPKKTVADLKGLLGDIAPSEEVKRDWLLYLLHAKDARPLQQRTAR